MLLSQFLSDPNNPHKRDGNPCIKCNTVYKKDGSFNCYFTPTQAMEFARHILAKAQLILDNGIDDAGVHLWSMCAETQESILASTNSGKVAGVNRRQIDPLHRACRNFTENSECERSFISLHIQAIRMAGAGGESRIAWAQSGTSTSRL